MNKNKVAKIILYSLLAALGGLVVALYIFQKDLVMEWYGIVVDVLNRPLPIVGVTTLAVLIFIWRLIVSTNYGKKVISGLRQELNSIKAEHEQYKIDSEKQKQEMINENGVLRQDIANICELSTNQKIKNYGKGLLEYGKERIDIETKEQ